MRKFLTPHVRRWAYGVAVAAVTVAVAAGWLPLEVSPVIAPLIMALLYVTPDGTPLEVTDNETGQSSTAG